MGWFVGNYIHTTCISVKTLFLIYLCGCNNNNIDNPRQTLAPSYIDNVCRTGVLRS